MPIVWALVNPPGSTLQRRRVSAGGRGKGIRMKRSAWLRHAAAVLRRGGSLKQASRSYRGARKSGHRRRARRHGRRANPVILSGNPRRRRRSRRGHRRNRPGIPFSGKSYRPRKRRKHGAIAWSRAAFSNPRGRRHRRHRRGRRGHRRNPPIYYNPMGSVGSLPGKALAAVKQAVAPDNLKKGAVIVGTMAAGFALPTMIAPSYDSGLVGIGLTGLVGAGVVALVGVAAPALSGIAVLGAASGILFKAAMMYARPYIFPTFSGMGSFLTVTGGRGMGQIPAGLIQGGRGMGDFLFTQKPVTSIGPTRSAALGGGERFSNFS